MSQSNLKCLRSVSVQYLAEPQSGSSKMVSFSTYYSVGLIIPSVTLGIIYLFSCVVGIILLITAKQSQHHQGYVFRLPLVIRLVISTVFVLLKIEPVKEQAASGEASTAEEGQEKRQYFELHIENKRLKSNFTVISIVVLAMTVIGCSFVTLWTVLFIDESTSCDEAGFDCFSDGKRVENCTILDNGIMNGTDYNFECYRIAFNYIQALAAAGGVTFFTTVVVNVLMVMIIAISSIGSEIYRWATAMLFSIFLLLLPVAVILCNIFVYTRF